MKTLKAASTAVAISLLTACGSGTWVDAYGPIGSDCNAELVDVFSGRDNVYGSKICGKASKHYTGVARCDGDRLQVQCE